MTDFDKARAVLRQFKGDSYLFGTGVLPRVGEVVARIGKKAALVRDTFAGSDNFVRIISDSLAQSGVDLVAEIPGARPNCPRQDLFRITEKLKTANVEVVISFGGGSTIDAAKAADVLCSLGGEIDAYFGTNLVTEAAASSGTAAVSFRQAPRLASQEVEGQAKRRGLTPHVAIQTAASSAA
ncbi:MAG: iron-containing alcohol dehydrogenase, partial [Sedimentisphaerales bacterium]